MEQTFLRTFWISKFSLQNLKRRMKNVFEKQCEALVQHRDTSNLYCPSARILIDSSYRDHRIGGGQNRKKPLIFIAYRKKLFKYCIFFVRIFLFMSLTAKAVAEILDLRRASLFWAEFKFCSFK